jgi:hypothetical protein
MRHLDAQIAEFSAQLKAEVGIGEDVSTKLATTVAGELRFLPAEAKNEILQATPVDVAARWSELTAFQLFMDQVTSSARVHPAVVRAQVAYQNYVCFVYLGESLFRVLAKFAPADSASRKCAKFLTDNPVRAFRNAFAHGNWCYREDFTGLVFWARKGSDPSEPLSRFEVEQSALNLWQLLARGVAYAAYPHLRAGAG